MKRCIGSIFYALGAIALVGANAYAQDNFEGPGVELVGSGACAFLQQNLEGSFDQVRVPAATIRQQHLGVTLSDVVRGDCTTGRLVVDRDANIPASWAEMMSTYGLDIRCHNVSATSECLGTWTQEKMPDGSVSIHCICSEDPL